MNNAHDNANRMTGFGENMFHCRQMNRNIPVVLNGRLHVTVC